MKKFKLYDNLLGWLAFFIAFTTYYLTIEPTTSWWDCGEYISTAYKLQVGHPPGAPLFQLIGRFFTLFAFGNLQNVALMINIMSALSSAFTILFLFWSITLLARKIVGTNELTIGQSIMILGSALVGSLTFTFSDSLWFSAVEGEVYAMSAFFTALVFWAILKWEEQAEEPHSIRWIVLIAYLIGLSIGVHLLNLLAIPAVAFVYYFKKYKISPKGIVLTSAFSVVLLAFIMYVVIPWIVESASKVEFFFVNSIGFPFNYGTFIYIAFLFALIGFGIYFTRKKGKLIANTALLSLLFIMIGYSSFFMISIRANTNTPINENDPSDAVSMLSYLNREQYGSRPLLHGQYFNSPLDARNPYSTGSPIYVKNAKTGKYIVTSKFGSLELNYDPRFTTIFPRMYSTGDDNKHTESYKYWGDVKGRPIQYTEPDGTAKTIYKPTFGENLTFFFRYQLNHMYLRYFMWNFVGRQNDIEGHGGIKNGNWISGVEFIDESRLGKQSDLPPLMQNPANNKYYFLPLILGLIGMFYHFKKEYKGGTAVALLFFMTGIAIVIYLNITPLQPRERDYAYVGSFYAFAIWIGLGVMYFTELLSKRLKLSLAASLSSAVCLLAVPTIMAQQNWDDHNRSGKFAARDFAVNYLNSCDKNAILITNGDNDTFPLWYAQEVEGVRTDVRVVNYMLSSSDWYVHQLARKIYDSEPLKFTLSVEQYDKGVNDMLYIFDKGVGRIELKEVMDFVASDLPQTKVTSNSGEVYGFLPTNKLKITVDSAKCVENGIVPKELADKIVPVIEWDVNSHRIGKNDLMLYDFLANNDWKRPLYFITPSVTNNVFKIDKYCYLTGVVYKFIPALSDAYIEGVGDVETESSLSKLLSFKWGNLNDPKVVVDRESMRNSLIPKQCFYRLARVLSAKGRHEDAVKIADKCVEQFPNSKFPFDIYMLIYPDIYYKAGKIDKANEMIKIIADNYIANINYFESLNQKFMPNYEEDRMQSYAIIANVWGLAKENNQVKLLEEIQGKLHIPEDMKGFFKL